MKIRWVILLLVASLAFNLAFVISWLTQKSPPREIHAPDNGLYVADLNLNPEQRESLKSIIKKSRIDLSQFKQDILAKRIEVVEEMSNPDYDPEILRKKTDELNQLENEMNHLFIDTLIQANNLLHPDQRLSFMVGLGKNWFRFKKTGEGNRPIHKRGRK
jgi:Spy/CpxP family protein refolding chaperone